MRYYLIKRFLTIKRDFVVLNNLNDTVLNVRGSFLRIGKQFRLYDHDTREKVFRITQKVLTPNEKQYILYQYNSQHQKFLQIATIRKKRRSDNDNGISYGALPPNIFFEIDSASGVVLHLRGDFVNCDFEIVDQYARIYGNISREFAFFRSKYTIDVLDNNYALMVISAAVVLDKLWKHGLKQK